jgi:uncharacterized OB-fold protein
MAEQRVPGAPGTNVENRAFWDAANEGRFLIKHCTGCDAPHFYPRAVCPHCFSTATEWRESPGRGVIYAFSVMRRVPRPYAIAYVTLDEGITVMTNIVDCDLDRLAIGQHVKVAFQSSETGSKVPVFVPA